MIFIHKFSTIAFDKILLRRDNPIITKNFYSFIIQMLEKF